MEIGNNMMMAANSASWGGDMMMMMMIGGEQCEVGAMPIERPLSLNALF